ncbi:hypothetical protein BB561_005788 [Smittium simulii]|uniref:Uncharacterized protein n=1 Tax=Smittium simulii TaxID=133385 RepID=A0A2T9Y8A0_9FUNG|nr:hypothetical protein BB561_005788 [Smittium simulii]
MTLATASFLTLIHTSRLLILERISVSPAPMNQSHHSTANLEYFFSTKVLNSRQLCWSELLGNYNVMMIHLPGLTNKKSDALSQRPGTILKRGDATHSLNLLNPNQIFIASLEYSVSDSEIINLILKLYASDPKIAHLLYLLKNPDSESNYLTKKALGNYRLYDGLILHICIIYVLENINSKYKYPRIATICL